MGRVIAALVAVSGSSPLDAQTVLLSRDQVIERALARSTEVARLRQTAVAGTRLAGATQYPANPVVSVELEGTPSPWSGQEYSRRVALEQEIDLRGERGARRGVSVASSRVLRQEATAREQEIAAEVDELAGRWLIARRRLGLLQPAVAQARALRQRAEQARRRELLTPFQARLLQADALEVEAAERAAVQDLEQSEAALLAWLHLPADSTFEIAEVDGALQWDCAPDSIWLWARSARADLARAEAVVELARSRVQLATRLGRVNPTVAISVGEERLEIDAAPTPLEDKGVFVGVAGSLPLPLFQTNRLERTEAQLELERAETERAALEVQLRRELGEACAALVRAEERRALLEPLAAAATEDLRLLESAYRDGRVELENYLSLRARLLQVQRESVEALANLEEVRSHIVRATGLRREVLRQRLGARAPAERR